VQTFVEIGSAVRKIFPDKKNKNKQIENISRVAQLTLGARLKKTRNGQLYAVGKREGIGP